MVEVQFPAYRYIYRCKCCGARVDSWNTDMKDHECSHCHNSVWKYMGKDLMCSQWSQD